MIFTKISAVLKNYFDVIIVSYFGQDNKCGVTDSMTGSDF